MSILNWASLKSKFENYVAAKHKTYIIYVSAIKHQGNLLLDIWPKWQLLDAAWLFHRNSDKIKNVVLKTCAYQHSM